MPADATCSTGTSRSRSRRTLGTTIPIAATTRCPRRPPARPPRGAQRHLLVRRAHPGPGSARACGPAARPDHRVRGEPERPGRARSTSSPGACASSTLPTPVACSGNRDPAAASSDRHQRSPETRSTYMRLDALPHREVHVVPGGRVDVLHERQRHQPQLGLHRGEQAQPPHAAAHLVPPVRPAGERVPVLELAPPAGAPWAAGGRRAGPARTATAGGAPGRTRRAGPAPWT